MVERLDGNVVYADADGPVTVVAGGVAAVAAFVVVPFAHVVALARFAQQGPAPERFRPESAAPLAGNYSVIHTRTFTPGVEYVFSTRRDTT